MRMHAFNHTDLSRSSVYICNPKASAACAVVAVDPDRRSLRENHQQLRLDALFVFSFSHSPRSAAVYPYRRREARLAAAALPLSYRAADMRAPLN